MANDPLDEMLQFLKPDAVLDLKRISLDYLLGLSGSEDGIKTLLNSEKLIYSIVELTNDKVNLIANNALFLLVNLSANSKGASELLKLKLYNKNIIDVLVGYVKDQDKQHADAVCMILSNITRPEDCLETCVDYLMKYVNDLLNIFVNTSYNKKGSNLDYLSPMFSHISGSKRIRKWLIEENPYVPLLKLLPFCNYDKSVIRKGGAIGTVRNLSLDTDCHMFLLRTDVDLLTYLLLPLMGNEEYPDDEMDQLPIALQYLPKEKERDADVDIRKMIIETLNQLCALRKNREILRANGVYYVLREYHKWEKDPIVLLACENVVDILIQKENEVGAEDLTRVEVPDDMKERFREMDEEYINSVK